jgi:hypothetical protein
VPIEASADPPLTYFKSQDRYRDLAIAPDGRRIYAVTDVRGRTVTTSGEMTGTLAHPGALLEFSYTGTPASGPR